jgi:hypothetical protein
MAVGAFGLSMTASLIMINSPGWNFTLKRKMNGTWF